jgi:hypothetical protein
LLTLTQAIMDRSYDQFTARFLRRQVCDALLVARL